MSGSRPAGDRVLVLDDDTDLLATLTDILRLQGLAQVRCARTIAEAEAILAAGFTPSAVVLDLILDGDRGERFASRLRADPAHAQVHLVALSGDHLSLGRARPIADVCLLKPASPDELLRALGIGVLAR